MLSTRLAPATAIIALAGALLVGCSATPAAPTDTAASTHQAGPTISPVSKHDKQNVQIVKIIGPTTFIATASDQSDPDYGTDFRLELADIVAPTQGECGYDQSLAKATELMNQVHTWLLRYPNDDKIPAVDADGVHHGYFSSLGATYGRNMTAAGMARPSNLIPNPPEEDAAKAANTGLWASCPDFAK